MRAVLSIGVVIALLGLLAIPAVFTAGPTEEGMVYMMEKFQFFQNAMDGPGECEWRVYWKAFPLTNQFVVATATLFTEDAILRIPAGEGIAAKGNKAIAEYFTNYYVNVSFMNETITR